jgi:hypothetical protein
LVVPNVNGKDGQSTGVNNSSERLLILGAIKNPPIVAGTGRPRTVDVDDKQRTQRLVHTLNGTGATINDPYQVWAVGGTVTDAHLFVLADWADLLHLVLAGCPITNQPLPAISRFQRLESLDIGGTMITSTGVAQAELPKSLTALGLSGIDLTEEAIAHITTLPCLRALNCNDCGLSLDDFSRLVAIPTLSSIEAVECPIDDESAAEMSRRTPEVLMNVDSGVWKAGTVHRHHQGK